MPLSLAKTTPPSTDPVTLAEAKAYLKLDDTAEDDLVTSLISTATEFCEVYTRRQFLDATFTLLLDKFPRTFRPFSSPRLSQSTILLPRAPLDSITSITYLDENDSSQTFAASNYKADTTSEPGRVILNDGASWPDILGEPHAVTITYVAGYGAAGDVPEGLKSAIKQLVCHWFGTARSPVVTGTIATELPIGTKALLDSFRVPEAA